MNDTPPLTERQLAIIDLIREELSETRSGQSPWFDWAFMAEELNVSRSTVRREVNVLCARYNCSLKELPRTVEMSR